MRCVHHYKARKGRLALESHRLHERQRRVAQRCQEDQLPLFEQPSTKKAIGSFHSKIAGCQFSNCDSCGESFPNLNVSSTSGQCTRCSRDKRQPKLYSRENGMEPGPVPVELQGLMQVEEMLISRVMPMMTLYRLPHGQYGYRGHIINLPQDISSFATSLPRLPSKLDVVLVRREGANGSHKEFQVRRSKILGGLEWLQQHNMYYRDITLNREALSQLPEDGDLADLATVPLEDPVADEEPREQSDDPYNAFLAGSFVPVNHRKDTEREIVQQAVAQGNSDD